MDPAPHAQHHIAVSRVVGDDARHLGNVIDKYRFGFARDAKRTRQGTTVCRHDGQFAGRIHLAKQHGIGRANHP